MNTDSTITDTYSLEIPKADTSLLKSLVKRMGWTVHKLQLNTPPTSKQLMTKSKGALTSMPVQMSCFPN